MYSHTLTLTELMSAQQESLDRIMKVSNTLTHSIALVVAHPVCVGVAHLIVYCTVYVDRVLTKERSSGAPPLY